MTFNFRPLPLLSLCLLSACQSGTAQLVRPQTLNQQSVRPQIQAPELKPEPPRLIYTPKPQPFARIESSQSTDPGKRSLHLSFNYPQLGTGFSTQAFRCGEVASASVEVYGGGLSSPIYADGSDPVTHRFAANTCSIGATLSNVPFGQLIFRIRLYNAAGQLLTGSELKGAVLVSQTVQTLELSYRQLIAAQIIESLRAGPIDEQFMAQQIDLPALQAKIEDIMQVTGTFPNYSFTHHPSLIDVPALVEALRNSSGDVSAINPQDPGYQLSPGSIQLQIDGVLSNQPLDLSVDDAVSANVQVNADGLVTISNLPPGTWQLHMDGPGYTPRVITVTVSEGGQTQIGNVSAPAPEQLPVLNSLNPNSGVPGSSITLTGNHFNTAALSNNTVRFGSSLATVTAATATSLTVTVPAGLSLGNFPVTVSVGNSSPTAAQTFTVVKPVITDLSPSPVSTGASLTLTGTNFNPTQANNTVIIGGLNATVTAASSTSLTVTVPAGLSGSVAVTVKNLASAVSDAVNLNILPTLSAINLTSGSFNQLISLTGTGFSPTPANNSVSIGGVSANVDSSSNTSLAVRVPAGVIAGSRSVTVSVAGQSSVSQTLTVLPTLDTITASQSISGQAALIRGETLTLTGHHFDPTLANNSVSFGAISAPAASVNATGTQLTVVVPAGVDTPGPVNLRVSTNAQLSQILSAVVPGVNVTVNGGFK